MQVIKNEILQFMYYTTTQLEICSTAKSLHFSSLITKQLNVNDQKLLAGTILLCLVLAWSVILSHFILKVQEKIKLLKLGQPEMDFPVIRRY